jgi:single-stranded-DNA-specific exonuclease
MKAEFYYDKRRYTCIFSQEDSLKELRIRNYQGLVLAVKQGQTIGLLG